MYLGRYDDILQTVGYQLYASVCILPSMLVCTCRYGGKKVPVKYTDHQTLMPYGIYPLLPHFITPLNFYVT